MAGGMGCFFHNENDSNCFLCSNPSREPPPSPLFLDITGYPPMSGEMLNPENIVFQPQMANQLLPNGAAIEAQRHENTPFTIEEVVALVQGVLDHGRGSWKQIKDEAFGNDNRRTRIDLRDKWKTLVRTANIPAHQRRGAVPPEWLLEIVRGVENGF